MTSPALSLRIHVAATWGMVGVIWFVQVVHYPLMAYVGQDGFAAYETLHRSWTTWVVLPLMAAEVASALLIRPRCHRGWPLLGLVLLAIIWLSTFLIQVPLHVALSSGFDAERHAQLVNSNWIRTVAWSLRGVVVLAMLRVADR